MKKTLKRFWPYMRQYKGYFALTVLGTLMVAFGTAAVPYLIQPVMDDIFINKDVEMLYALPAVIIVIHIIKGVGTYIQAYYTSLIGQDIVRRIRDELLSVLIRLELGFFQASQKGALISRITNDTGRIQGVVSNAVPYLIRDFLSILALMGVVIYQNPALAFMGLIILPVAGWPLSKLSRRMKRLSATSQIKVGNMTSRLSEIFQNVEIIKGYNAESHEEARFAHDNKEFFRYTMKGVKTNQLVSPLMETLGSIGVAVVILVGGHQVIEGEMSVGAFFSFMTALFMLYTPIKNISRLYNSMQDGVAAGERIFEYLDMKTAIQDGPQVLAEPINDIRLEHINVTFGQTKALRDIQLHIRSGERIALVGMSGGGKSTLVNLLPRFVDPSGGAVIINGIDSKQYTLASLRNQIGIVTQQLFLLGDTIAANVAYGREWDAERIIEVLKLANAWEFVSQMPNGIETYIGEGGAGLSGGQKQRLSIARALYKNPSLFILDEATSALDNESEAKVQEALERATAGKITLTIAHRLSTVKNADRILLLSKGAIVCSGSEAQLIQNCPEFRQLHHGSLLP
ncbi:MAG: ABC transporter ATP-binding protein [Campylobacterales bacterium]